MTLKDQCNEYINLHGPDKIASALGKKETTVKTWQRTGNYPLELIELMQSNQTQSQPASDISDNAKPTTSAGNTDELLMGIAQLLQKQGEQIAKLEQKNAPVVARPAGGPQVVRKEQPDIEDTGFQTTAILGGPQGFSEPEETNDLRGMHMKTLLSPRKTEAQELNETIKNFIKMQLAQQEKK